MLRTKNVRKSGNVSNKVGIDLSFIKLIRYFRDRLLMNYFLKRIRYFKKYINS